MQYEKICNIPQCKSLFLLGVTLRSNCMFSEHVTLKLVKANRCNARRHGGFVWHETSISPFVRLSFFKSFVIVDIYRDLFLLRASYYSYVILVYWGRDVHRIHKWQPTWVELAAKHDIEAFKDKHAVFLRREGENERSTCEKLHSWFFFKWEKVIGIKIWWAMVVAEMLERFCLKIKL